MNQFARRLFAVSGLTVLLAISSSMPDLQEPASAEGCSLEPVPGGSSGLLGVPVAAAVCLSQVEVAGRVYIVGVGRVLDKAKLKLAPFGEVARANSAVIDPAVWSLDGVDPASALVMGADPEARDDNGPFGEYVILWAPDLKVPVSLCQYLSDTDPQYPADSCPLRPDRAYEIEMPVACAQTGSAIRIGGTDWVPDSVISAEIFKISGPVDYGTVDLSDGLVTYRSEVGLEFVLRPAPAGVESGNCDPFGLH
jgi:hypothetical protein